MVRFRDGGPCKTLESFRNFETVKLWLYSLDVCIKLTIYCQFSFMPWLRLLRCEHGRSWRSRRYEYRSLLVLEQYGLRSFRLCTLSIEDVRSHRAEHATKNRFQASAVRRVVGRLKFLLIEGVSDELVYVLGHREAGDWTNLPVNRIDSWSVLTTLHFI